MLGQVSTQGWWYYFPLVFLAKTPIPLLLLLLAALLGGTLRKLEPPARLELICFGLLPAGLWMAAACLSPFQIGIRHILSVLPFCCLAAGVAVGRWWRQEAWKRGAVGLALLWYAAGTVMIHPHYLAYFNEAAGGPGNARKLFVESNLDWGQELQALGELVRQEGGPPIYLCYFGNADPHLYGIRYVPILYFTELDRPGDPVEPFRSAKILFAISATNMESVYYSDKSAMRWLDAYQPYKVLGGSIFVYDFTRQPEALKRLAQLLAARGERERSEALSRWLAEPGR
jgi:hypothetical protein